MKRFKLNSIDGEMEASPEGEWVHIEDIPSDPVRDKLWTDVYLEQKRSKYNSRQAVELANAAVRDYDERK